MMGASTMRPKYCVSDRMVTILPGWHPPEPVPRERPDTAARARLEIGAFEAEGQASKDQWRPQDGLAAQGIGHSGERGHGAGAFEGDGSNAPVLSETGAASDWAVRPPHRRHRVTPAAAATYNGGGPRIVTALP